MMAAFASRSTRILAILLFLNSVVALVGSYVFFFSNGLTSLPVESGKKTKQLISKLETQRSEKTADICIDLVKALDVYSDTWVGISREILGANLAVFVANVGLCTFAL